MADFSFHGPIAASKSLLNRALIIQSYGEGIELKGSSLCDDVVLMRSALEQLGRGEKRFHCGHAGTVFRFLALRVSRLPGEWTLLASPRLLSRPQVGLFKIFQQLGVTYQMTPAGLFIQSSGWNGSQLTVDGSESSQFLSSIFLNGWELPQDLEIKLQGDLVSQSYFELTKTMVQYFGMQLEQISATSWKIAARQVPVVKSYSVEPDMSSCFAIAACAAIGGTCRIENFPEVPQQPDAVFREFFTAMGINWSQDGSVLSVSQARSFLPLSVNVKNCPDVVPVLSVLLARASGVSRLTGFGHLVHKESNRLAKVQELLTLLGRRWDIIESEFVIYGEDKPFNAVGVLNPDEDHRMAMAAQVANFGGATLEILDKNVVNKSFPEFWPIVEAR